MRSAFCNRVPKGFLSYRFKQAIKMEAPCVFLRLIVIDPSRSPITTDPRWPEQQLLLVLPAWMWDHSPSFPNFWRLLIAFNDPKKIETSDLPRSYIENPKPINMMVLGWIVRLYFSTFLEVNCGHSRRWEFCKRKPGATLTQTWGTMAHHLHSVQKVKYRLKVLHML